MAVKTKSLLCGFYGSDEHGVVLDNINDIHLEKKLSKPLLKHQDTESTICNSDTSSGLDTSNHSSGSSSSSSSSSNCSDNKTDDELLKEADDHSKEDRVMDAVHLLRQVNDQARVMQNQHYKQLLERATIIESTLSDLLLSPKEGEWKYQSCWSGGKYNTDVIVHYKVDDTNKMTVRLEALMPASLVVPMFAVMNEVDLWTTWMPSFTTPCKMGICDAKTVKQIGNNLNQEFQAGLFLPWPMSNRAIYSELFNADIAIGDNNDNDDGRLFLCKVQGLDGDPPMLKKGIERIDFEASVMVRRCPPDHHTLLRQKSKHPNKMNTAKEPMVLLAGSGCLGCPSLNFFTRSFFGPMVIALIKTAERIQDGKLPKHEIAMTQTKKQVYDRLQSKVDGLGFS